MSILYFIVLAVLTGLNLIAALVMLKKLSQKAQQNNNSKASMDVNNNSLVITKTIEAKLSLYSLLSKLYEKMEIIALSNPSGKYDLKYINAAYFCYKNLYLYYEENKIFLNEELCKKIELLRKDYWEKIVFFYKKTQAQNWDKERFDFTGAVEPSKQIIESISTIKSQLEVEFKQ